MRPRLTFHLAGVMWSQNPTEFYRVNTQYAVALLQALEDAGAGDCPVLLVGTAAEYGTFSEKDLPIREDLPPRPYNHYGISKLAQTFEGLSSARRGRPVVIVRPFNLMGPGMPGNLVLQAVANQISRIWEGQAEPVIRVGNLSTSRDFVDVRDAVMIYWELLQKKDIYGEVVNVCTGEGTVVEDLVRKLVGLSGIDIDIQTDPSLFKPVDIPVHYGSTEKLRSILGYAPRRDILSSLADTLEYTVGRT